MLAAPVAAVVAIPLALVLPGGSASAASTRTYVVVYSGSADAGRAAVTGLGGKILSENAEVGLAVVTTSDASFETRAGKSAALVGAAPNAPIGYAVPDAADSSSGSQDKSFTQRERDLARAGGSSAPARPGRPAAGGEPLSSLQWDMQMMGATPTGSYKYQPGSRGVLVGVIDTGIDGSHPDVAPNFNKGLSRNFVTDIPTDPASGEEVDGPCEHPSCVDPIDEDDDGHGTHVASTIASPVNGLGIAGVAPNVQVVNVRAGQDSGLFFLKPTVDAITYAGDVGIDVVNMSFYTDPYLFNCAANPADSPERQAEQRTIIAATQRAVAYASAHGVTLIAAAGNESIDTGHPSSDDTSPDYPPSGNAAYPRVIDNSCLSMPSEAPGVLDVNAVGPSKRLSYYSNYGLEQTVVAAPGGDGYDGSTTSKATNLILAAYPKNVAQTAGDIDGNGNPTSPFVVRDDSKGKTSYYQYLQGTSMASPHAVGVAAIIISALGHWDLRHGGLTLDPKIVQQQLQRTAVPTACPTPNPYVYPAPVPAESTKTCEGTTKFNGFYGNGIVSALNASKIH